MKSMRIERQSRWMAEDLRRSCRVEMRRLSGGRCLLYRELCDGLYRQCWGENHKTVANQMNFSTYLVYPVTLVRRQQIRAPVIITSMMHERARPKVKSHYGKMSKSNAYNQRNETYAELADELREMLELNPGVKFSESYENTQNLNLHLRRCSYQCMRAL